MTTVTTRLHWLHRLTASCAYWWLHWLYDYSDYFYFTNFTNYIYFFHWLIDCSIVYTSIQDSYFCPCFLTGTSVAILTFLLALHVKSTCYTAVLLSMNKQVSFCHFLFALSAWKINLFDFSSKYVILSRKKNVLAFLFARAVTCLYANVFLWLKAWWICYIDQQALVTQ